MRRPEKKKISLEDIVWYCLFIIDTSITSYSTFLTSFRCHCCLMSKCALFYNAAICFITSGYGKRRRTGCEEWGMRGKQNMHYFVLIISDFSRASLPSLSKVRSACLPSSVPFPLYGDFEFLAEVNSHYTTTNKQSLLFKMANTLI